MKHPCLLKNTQGYDYTEQMLNIQMPQIVYIPSDFKKIIKI